MQAYRQDAGARFNACLESVGQPTLTTPTDMPQQ